MAADVHATIDAVWRMEAPRIIAALVRVLRDVGTAEELAQDALVAALDQWPRDGVPDKPGAWLMTTARNRAIDRIRHRVLVEKKHEAISHDLDDVYDEQEARMFAALDDDIGDDLLRLVFTACHPVLSPEAQVALTLRLLGGLSTDEIARAFLVPEATIAQRIVRAKRALADPAVVYEVPRGEDLQARLAAVLRVVYLVFNEGYAATAGGDWMRPALCDEALRLGRVLAGLMPLESEVHGLVALMELQASRASARTSADGAPILLLEQDRSRWDRLLIQRGLAALATAERLGGAAGPYALQAALAACHARAARPEDTDWNRIHAVYQVLLRQTPSPVIELNRAVALSMAQGPAAALEVVDRLKDDPALSGYHLLPSVRGDLLSKLGRHDEAAAEFHRAAAMTRNDRERRFVE